MIRLAITFLILALVAALLGFGNFAGDLAWIAKVLILVFAVLAILSFVMGRRVVDSGI